MLGDASITAEYGNFTFRFASEAARALFTSEPARYVPSWGGFCAYGIADESWWTKASLGPQADPQRWAIVDDRLFVFRGEKPRAQFLADETAIEKGDVRWSAWFDSTAFNTGCFFYSDDDKAQ